MTLHDLLSHHRDQLKAVSAYFDVSGAKDGKTAKTYRVHVATSKARVEILEKTIDLLSAIDPESPLLKTTGENQDDRNTEKA